MSHSGFRHFAFGQQPPVSDSRLSCPNGHRAPVSYPSPPSTTCCSKSIEASTAIRPRCKLPQQTGAAGRTAQAGDWAFRPCHREAALPDIVLMFFQNQDSWFLTGVEPPIRVSPFNRTSRPRVGQPSGLSDCYSRPPFLNSDKRAASRTEAFSVRLKRSLKEDLTHSDNHAVNRTGAVPVRLNQCRCEIQLPSI